MNEQQCSLFGGRKADGSKLVLLKRSQLIFSTCELRAPTTAECRQRAAGDLGKRAHPARPRPAAPDHAHKTRLAGKGVYASTPLEECV